MILSMKKNIESFNTCNSWQIAGEKLVHLDNLYAAVAIGGS